VFSFFKYGTLFLISISFSPKFMLYLLSISDVNGAGTEPAFLFSRLSQGL
jgi:hypothetical protein